MKELTVYQIGHEHCMPDKEAVRQISVYNMLHFVVSGRGTFNGQELHAGQIFLCRRRQYVNYSPDPKDPWDYYWINSSGAMADELFAGCGLDKVNVMDFTMTEQVEKLLKLSANHPNQGYLGGIFIALMELLGERNRYVQMSSPERHLADAIDLIRSKSGKITPSELAEQLNLSRAYLRNIFMELRGMTVIDYIIRYRMNCAAELLAQTDYPIYMIAATVGYEDQFQFSKRFRKVHGKSPSNYRKMMRSINGTYISLMQPELLTQTENINFSEEISKTLLTKSPK
ncbi:MAG: AraC family transcriptional regulator [Clostridia bacterium]|nr:AraC family transcriptional regulator [Clostridia bacterium]